MGRREVPEDLLADDFVMENVATAVTSRRYVGAEGMKQWFEDILGVFGDDYVYEAHPRESGEDYVVAWVRMSGTGLISGAPLDMSHWGVAWVRGGKVTRAAGYASHREALAAVGR